MRFEDIHGNGTTVSALRNMVDGGRIPHALMFHENDGGGAIPLALAFIQYLYCRSRSDGDSCGECPVCRRVTKLIHPDIQFICPIASSKEKPTSESYISEIRELLEKNPYFYEHELYSALGIEGKQAAIAVPEARSILSKLSLSGVEGGWRTVIEGKHEESAYFAYFDRDLGVRTILAMRKMKNHGPYKPYAIIDKFSFEATIGELKKGTPL